MGQRGRGRLAFPAGFDKWSLALWCGAIAPTYFSFEPAADNSLGDINRLIVPSPDRFAVDGRGEAAQYAKIPLSEPAYDN